MNPTNALRRFAAGAAIVAVGATTALSGAGAASADTVGPATGSSDAVNFSRTVSGAKVVGGAIPNGEVITVTNTLNRKLGWLIYYVKDTHPTCMQAVPNTAVWTVSGKTYTNNPNHPGIQKSGEFSDGPGWAQIKPAAVNSWESIKWSQDYFLNCSVGTLNTGGVEYDTTWVGDKGNHPNVGPNLTLTPGIPGIVAAPQDASVANEVMITVKNPDGKAGDRVALTSNGKTLDGCGNLELTANRMVTCTWVPKKSGNYPLKAVISSDPAVTVTGSIYVSDSGAGSLGGGSSDTGSLNGILFTGSVS
ncbi:hypothetical protein [Gordonia sp. (in: high G+C Gram-positive bacteria)]|uniref:hypothetical protein n=1 Tax=Gordonia sp. (in: high G+C Gram-positive bacteria) TaxID=84139 RepID=UPI003C73646D